MLHDDQVRIRHMLETAHAITAKVERMSRATFDADENPWKN